MAEDNYQARRHIQEQNINLKDFMVINIWLASVLIYTLICLVTIRQLAVNELYRYQFVTVGIIISLIPCLDFKFKFLKIDE